MEKCISPVQIDNLTPKQSYTLAPAEIEKNDWATAGHGLNAHHKSDAAKNVIIIGAGPAGMQAAITACDRGHDVTIVSQGLGGQLSEAASPPEKGSFLLFRDYLIHEIRKRPIQIVEDTVSAPSDISDYRPDHIILAFGCHLNHKLVSALHQSFANISVIGNAENPRRILDAVNDAYAVAAAI